MSLSPQPPQENYKRGVKSRARKKVTMLGLDEGSLKLAWNAANLHNGPEKRTPEAISASLAKSVCLTALLN